MFQIYERTKRLFEKFIKSQPVCLNCFCDLTDGLSVMDLFRKEDVLCGYCREQLIPLRKTVPVLDFEVYSFYQYESFFEKMIFQVKENKDVTLAPVFLHPYISFLRKICEEKTVVLVPSSDKKTKSRGFEPLREFYKELGAEMLSPFEKDDVKQSLRTANQRSKIKNHLRLKYPEMIIDKELILLDDVCSTGYSIKACIDLMKPHSKSIKVVVLALNTGHLNGHSYRKSEYSCN